MLTGSSDDEQDISYPPYKPTVRQRPHRERQRDSDSEEEEAIIDEEQRLIDWWGSSDYQEKRRVKGTKFGYVDAEDAEGREFEVPCCTSCGTSWCGTLCERNPIKKCTSCGAESVGLTGQLFQLTSNTGMKNRTCSTRQPPTVGIVDPRARLYTGGGRSRKRTKRKKRRKTKKGRERNRKKRTKRKKRRRKRSRKRSRRR